VLGNGFKVDRVKLYEFEYIDNQKLSHDVLSNRVGEFLMTESESQSWAPGYIFRQCRAVEQLASGELKYGFEVIGRYLDDDSLDFESNVRTSDEITDGRAAKEVNP
jgi:hypothetical protein